MQQKLFRRLCLPSVKSCYAIVGPRLADWQRVCIPNVRYSFGRDRETRPDHPATMTPSTAGYPDPSGCSFGHREIRVAAYAGDCANEPKMLTRLLAVWPAPPPPTWIPACGGGRRVIELLRGSTKGDGLMSTARFVLSRGSRCRLAELSRHDAPRHTRRRGLRCGVPLCAGSRCPWGDLPAEVWS